MRGWLNTFANPFCAALPSEERGAFLDEVTVLLKGLMQANFFRSIQTASDWLHGRF
jgi:hypothetical protein